LGAETSFWASSSIEDTLARSFFKHKDLSIYYLAFQSLNNSGLAYVKLLVGYM
jgi:hypothetical protein